ncbi:cyclase, partial [Microbacterium sp. ISL-103]|uniref:SRPBCC family protein n=1 Tax=Microbacterium sp. ISL-103 TaxID=2819156 RepID=UPI001C1A18A8
MVQIIETIDVHVPIDVAYNQWTQFESFPHFPDEVESNVQIDDTHNRWTVKVAGATRELDTEITEQHP